MRKPLSPYLFIAVLSFALQSCLSTANFETGKTLGKSVSKTDIGFSYEYSQPIVKGGWFNFNEGPFISVAYTYGILDRLDIGAGISTNSDLNFRTKFMLTKPESKFAVSIGASTYIITNIEEVFLYHTNLSLFVSAHPSEKLAIYFYPQYLFFPSTVSLNNDNSTTGGSITFGLLFNNLWETRRKTISIGCEFSNFSAAKYQQQTFTIGVIIKRKYDPIIRKDPQYFY